MVKVEVYFSPVCPHCPGARKLVTEVVSQFGGSVEVEEVNTYTKEGMERGMANQVMAVPTVFVDGERKFVGFPFSRQDLEDSIRQAQGDSP
ncbi:MAG TPA: thioredoxin family protein [Patescibacteria group bacterium]|nr:thioredoxin family protein [Patescibacteria group bacterium]